MDMLCVSSTNTKKSRCHGNRKLQHFKRKCRAQRRSDVKSHTNKPTDQLTLYKPSKYLKMPKKLLLQSLRLQLNYHPLKKKSEQKFILARLTTLDQQFCLDQLHRLYRTYYEQGVQSQVWLDEIVKIVGSNETDTIQTYVQEYTILLQNQLQQYHNELTHQAAAYPVTLTPLEFIDERLKQFVRSHHRDLVRVIKLKQQHLNADVTISHLSKQIVSFKLNTNQNEMINQLIGIRMKQLKIFEKLIQFEQDILCHQLPNSMHSMELDIGNSDIAEDKRWKMLQDIQRRHIHRELEQYELDIQSYEQMFHNEFHTFQSDVSKSNTSYPVNWFSTLIYAVKRYIYEHIRRTIYTIRYKESCRLVTLKHRCREQLPSKNTLHVYPQIISDVLKVPLNRCQLNFLSRTGPSYIRPNQSYLYGLERRNQHIQDEHKTIMNSITSHLIRVHHIPTTSTIIKQFSDSLLTYLQQSYKTPLFHLHIYRMRKELQLVKAIRYRLNKGNCILRTTDKSGIFHLGHVKDYEQKIQAYRERTQAYVEVNDNPLSLIFDKVVRLLNELRSKKHIQAKHMDEMIPRAEKVSLGYLYFIPKPHKEGTPLRPIVSSMNTPTTGISKFLDRLLRPLFDKHARSTTIIDGVDLIRRLDTYVEQDKLKPTTHFCTFDITDLYTMLPQEQSLNILTEFLLEYGYHKVKGIPIDAIRKLARIVLTENVFVYDKKYYRQILGGAMGSAFTLTLANIFMWKWEKQLVQRLHSSNEIYGRYIDDIFFTSNESLDTIHQMLDEVNASHPNIKLIRHIGTSASFLDLSIENENGTLSTSVYHKEAAEPYTVPFRSDHPRHTFANIIDNALIRAIRYSSTLSIFNVEQRTIKLMLLYNGYPPRYIHSHFNRFVNIKPFNQSIIPMFETESYFQLIRSNLLHKPTVADLQIASRLATVTNQMNISYPELTRSTIDDISKEKQHSALHTDNLIIHYTHEGRFQTFKRDVHHLWKETFESTPIVYTKLIVGHRNHRNATRELVRRRPHHMPKLLISKCQLQQTTNNLQ